MARELNLVRVRREPGYVSRQYKEVKPKQEGDGLREFVVMIVLFFALAIIDSLWSYYGS